MVLGIPYLHYKMKWGKCKDMKVISFLNIKGGVAKTTSCVNIAAELGKQGHKVLMIDLDPQSNATKYLNMYNPDTKGTYELLAGEDVPIQGTIYEGLWMVHEGVEMVPKSSP